MISRIVGAQIELEPIAYLKVEQQPPMRSALLQQQSGATLPS